MEKYKYCNTTKTTVGNDNKMELHRCVKKKLLRGLSLAPVGGRASEVGVGGVVQAAQ